MKHQWDVDACVSVFEAETNSFVQLAKIALLSPATDFRNTDLSDVDFGTDDLAGFDFRGANLSGANLESVVNLPRSAIAGAQTSSRTKLPKRYWANFEEEIRQAKNLANRYRRIGALPKALDVLGDAHRREVEFYGEHSPALRSVMHRMANIYNQLGNTKRAIEIFRGILMLRGSGPRSDSENNLIIKINIAQILTEIGDYQPALEMLKNARGVNPKHMSRHNYIQLQAAHVVLAEKLNDDGLMIDLINELILYHRENSGLQQLCFALLSYGNMLYRRGHEKLASDLFLEAIPIHKKTEMRDTDKYADAVGICYRMETLAKKSDNRYMVLLEMIRLMDRNFVFPSLNRATACMMAATIATADGRLEDATALLRSANP